VSGTGNGHYGFVDC